MVISAGNKQTKTQIILNNYGLKMGGEKREEPSEVAY
jgi:hypothetical protein